MERVKIDNYKYFDKIVDLETNNMIKDTNLETIYNMYTSVDSYLLKFRLNNGKDKF